MEEGISNPQQTEHLSRSVFLEAVSYKWWMQWNQDAAELTPEGHARRTRDVIMSLPSACAETKAMSRASCLPLVQHPASCSFTLFPGWSCGKEVGVQGVGLALKLVISKPLPYLPMSALPDVPACAPSQPALTGLEGAIILLYILGNRSSKGWSSLPQRCGF